MFTVMIDKEINQHEKKKTATTAGEFLFLLQGFLSTTQDIWLVGKGFQSTPNVCTANS